MTAWLTIYAVVPFVIFLLMFGRPRTKWWRDAAGVSVFVLSAVVVGVVGLAVLRYMFDVVPPAWVREVIYVLIGTAGIVQLVTYLRTRSTYRRATRSGAERRRRSDDHAI